MIDKIRKQGAEDIVKAVTNNMHELSDKWLLTRKNNMNELRELERRHDAMQKLLVEIIQILDYSYTKDVQDTGNAIGLIRSKVDNLLNKGE